MDSVRHSSAEHMRLQRLKRFLPNEVGDVAVGSSPPMDASTSAAPPRGAGPDGRESSPDVPCDAASAASASASVPTTPPAPESAQTAFVIVLTGNDVKGMSPHPFMRSLSCSFFFACCLHS